MKKVHLPLSMVPKYRCLDYTKSAIKKGELYRQNSVPRRRGNQIELSVDFKKSESSVGKKSV